MKKYIKIYAMVAVIMLFFASCSTDKVETPIDDENSQFTTITFGSLLNDLANRSMQKGHFAQIPTCADAEPEVAVIEFSYGGSDFSTTVDILSDGSGYFTDYSDDLKIPVSSNSSTIVTVTSFMVYDGDTSVASDAFYSPINGNLIWIAPKGDDAQFDGYVENALPVQFEVFPGTKPYFDIEVLCFDKRVVNEYGYVFFDIVPKTISPLCLFVNYCNEDGRHWVADYSIDLFFGTDANGVQLYSNTNSNAMATTGTTNGEFSADPLCLVVPSHPANLDDDEPYLFLVIYPQDWTNSYGDIDNTPIPVALSWNMVNDLLNDDGTSNEYLHLLVGECEDALEGDGTIPGGGGTGGGNECDPNDAQADCDGDGVPNGNDNCDNTPVGTDVGADGCPLDGGDSCATNPTGPTCDPDGDNLTNEEEAALGTDPNDADSDNDGIEDDVDVCPNTEVLSGQVDPDGDGCFTDPVAGCTSTDCDLTTDVSGFCFTSTIDLLSADKIYRVEDETTFNLFGSKGSLDPRVKFGEVNVSVDNNMVKVILDTPEDIDKIKGYKVKVFSSDADGNINTNCFQTLCDNNIALPEGNQEALPTLSFNNLDYSYPIYITVETVICEDVPGTPGI